MRCSSRYSELQDRFRLGDGYSMDLRIATVLRGLGFSPEDAERPAETFSGGWQMRIALAKLLLGRPNLLLLDEPTNHLDLEARNWLEEYLGAYPYAVILVSHDRYFLDAVVTRITDLNLRKLTDYVGNYSKYVEQRDAMLERLRQAKREQDEEVARVKMFIDRFRYQATKAAQVQSRIKLLEKVVPIEVPPERKRIHFSFPACAKSGRTVLELKHARKAYGPVTVFRNLSLHIERGDRIALVGPNGAGKSTLMRMLSGEETPDSGTRTVGHQVVMEYFAQDEATRLESGPDGLRNAGVGIADRHGAGDSKHPRRISVFGRRRLQEGRRAVGRRAHAAGGRAHAAATVEHAAARRADEPSRSRFEGRPARSARGLRRHADLRLARSLLRREAGDEDHRDRSRRGGRLPGTYTEFLWSKEHQGDVRESSKAQIPKPKSQKTSQKFRRPKPVESQIPNPESREARKRQEAERRKKQRAADALQKRISDLESRIAEREAQVKELEATMAAPGFYENLERVKPVIDRHQALMWEVGDLIAQWEALQEHAAQQPSEP